MTRKMKDSGIEWIGEIPEDWKISKIKHISRCLDGRRIPIDASLRKDGKYPYWGAGSIQGYVDGYIFDEEIILLGEDGAPFFDKSREVAFLIDEKVWVNNHIHVLKGTSIENPFLVYFLNIVDYTDYINGSILKKLTQSNMKNISVASPDSTKQIKIIELLNRKTEQIENIKSTIIKEIQTLEDYKKSVITEAVTKGLDKNVPMKDSGIGWVGQIPVHWNLRKLKFSFKFYAGGDIDNSDFSPVETQIHKYPILANSLENKGVIGYMSKYRFKENTITVTGRGEVGVAYPRFMKYFPVVRLLVGVPITKIDVRYSSYCINSFIVVGEQTAMTQLTTSKIGEYTIPNPSFEEQIKIADYLDNKCQIIDETISLKQKQLEILEKYKKSLIYEYVTGKKEVKDGEES